MRVGGVDLEDGKVVKLVVGSVPTVPTFNPLSAGEFTFSLDDGVIRFNNGTKMVPLNTTVSEDPNLIVSLNGATGTDTNWLNSNLSFNPTNFNTLSGITGLTSADNLFTVISRITDIIDTISQIELEDITIPSNTPNMSVVGAVAGTLLLLDINDILEGSSIELTFDNLSGFDITDDSDGNLVAFNAEGKLTSRKTHYRYENLTESVSHLITHNLGEKYCSVFCIDPQTDMMIVPQEILFSTDYQLVVTFPVKHKLIALVTNMPRPD